ncbi:MAG TPA: tetratricopeptide repeat protein, partial [Terriglobales bacterium]|nr:tetratricopeptide repeat protein [Terriglobales bacterium]
MSERHFASLHSSRLLRAPLLLVIVLLLAWLGGIATAQSPDLAKLSAEGQTALQDKQYERAVQAYEQIIKADPRSALAHSNLGLALYMSAQYP